MKELLEPFLPWTPLASDDPSLFDRLRERRGAEVSVALGIGAGKHRVDIPAATIRLQGKLRVEERADRFGIEVPGWGPTDFAWFARRKGRGHPDYWQAAIEYRPEGQPALVLYLTAPLDGLEIRLRLV